VAAFVAKADKLEILAQGFAQQMRRLAHADAVPLRWADQANQPHLTPASRRLPQQHGRG